MEFTSTETIHYLSLFAGCAATIAGLGLTLHSENFQNLINANVLPVIYKHTPGVIYVPIANSFNSVIELAEPTGILLTVAGITYTLCEVISSI